MVIKHMVNRYKPDNATAMAECASRLMRLRLGPTANPADLFTKIADIQAQYESANYTIDQRMIVSTVLRAAPVQYKSVIPALQVSKGNSMTVSDLEDAMDLYHRNVINVAKPTGRNKAVGGDEGKVTLSGFTGACYKCGEMGHTKANCPKKVVSKKTNKNKIPRRKCETCGKEHAGPCWEDKANAHLRPANWKSAKTTGGNIVATAVEQANTEGEYVLSGIAGMDWKKLLMPEGVSETEDLEVNSAQRVIMDDVAEGIIHYDQHWFPYEWFLDSDSVPTVADVLVTAAKPVMKDHNKNRKSQLVDQIANGYLLEHELGLKTMEKVGKEITFPNVRAMLSDPDFFIADSGATTHATASLKGMKNLRM
jgi:Zinc knuckle